MKSQCTELIKVEAKFNSSYFQYVSQVSEHEGSNVEEEWLKVEADFNDIYADILDYLEDLGESTEELECSGEEEEDEDVVAQSPDGVVKDSPQPKPNFETVLEYF